jgi:3D (Asp-Asp-Asp) domain-containing protein
LQGNTCAADLAIFPYGTLLMIEGVGMRIVDDTGGAIRGTRLDIFFNEHNDALMFGRVKRKVQVVDGY